MLKISILKNKPLQINYKNYKNSNGYSFNEDLKLAFSNNDIQTCEDHHGLLTRLLCGYRQVLSTQHALLKLIESWRQSLDSRGYSRAVVMDLSKALDTINHELLIA